jgi:hypothetical protein
VELPVGTSLAGFGSKSTVYGSVKQPDGSRTVGRLEVR